MPPEVLDDADIAEDQAGAVEDVVFDPLGLKGLTWTELSLPSSSSGRLGSSSPPCPGLAGHGYSHIQVRGRNSQGRTLAGQGLVRVTLDRLWWLGDGVSPVVSIVSLLVVPGDLLKFNFEWFGSLYSRSSRLLTTNP